ncbi:hypothetical protein T01_12805 [Trichinella spiralis]|uniref:Uncharacterized protein n=1 Tax=Trichinella spiralis TaxID=6334 RepID=A0A0V1BRU0_TRISP|nr:hypothetical protein T01_12805 [Trichinella spiralis]
MAFNRQSVTAETSVHKFELSEMVDVRGPLGDRRLFIYLFYCLRSKQKAQLCFLFNQSSICVVWKSFFEGLFVVIFAFRGQPRCVCSLASSNPCNWSTVLSTNKMEELV